MCIVDVTVYGMCGRVIIDCVIFSVRSHSQL